MEHVSLLKMPANELWDIIPDDLKNSIIGSIQETVQKLQALPAVLQNPDAAIVRDHFYTAVDSVNWPVAFDYLLTIMYLEIHRPIPDFVAASIYGSDVDQLKGTIQSQISELNDMRVIILETACDAMVDRVKLVHAYLNNLPV